MKTKDRKQNNQVPTDISIGAELITEDIHLGKPRKPQKFKHDLVENENEASYEVDLHNYSRLVDQSNDLLEINFDDKNMPLRQNIKLENGEEDNESDVIVKSPAN